MSRWLNLDIANYKGVGHYEIPELEPTPEYLCTANDWIGFNYCLSTKRTVEKKNKTGVHFFLTDDQFERCWKDPQRYGEMLRQYKCVLSPDFSMWGVFPTAVNVWNNYRKHWLGKYWQDMGLTVIPTIAWGDEETFDWCFDGDPKHSVVAVSNVGCVKSKKAQEIFLRGYEEMLKRLEPSLVLCYAHTIRDYPGNVKFIKFKMDKSREAT